MSLKFIVDVCVARYGEAVYDVERDGDHVGQIDAEKVAPARWDVLFCPARNEAFNQEELREIADKLVQVHAEVAGG